MEYDMTTDRREVFEPEDLAILGSAFDQIWRVVASELGDTDHTRKVAARRRLANIMLQLAKLSRLEPDEIKRMAIQIFQSIEVRNDRADPRLRHPTLTSNAIEGG